MLSPEQLQHVVAVLKVNEVFESVTATASDIDDSSPGLTRAAKKISSLFKHSERAALINSRMTSNHGKMLMHRAFDKFYEWNREIGEMETTERARAHGFDEGRAGYWEEVDKCYAEIRAEAKAEYMLSLCDFASHVFIPKGKGK